VPFGRCTLCDREKAAIAAARLEEAEWWFSKRDEITWQLYGKRLEEIRWSVAARPEPASGPPPATKEGART
jgi:hypothetical protein